MPSSTRHCPRCGQLLRARDVQCDACLHNVPRVAQGIDPMLPCSIVLAAGAALLLWQLFASLL